MFRDELDRALVLFGAMEEVKDVFNITWLAIYQCFNFEVFLARLMRSHVQKWQSAVGFKVKVGGIEG